jgi:hypothetical protein
LERTNKPRPSAPNPLFQLTPLRIYKIGAFLSAMHTSVFPIYPGGAAKRQLVVRMLLGGLDCSLYFARLLKTR